LRGVSVEGDRHPCVDDRCGTGLVNGDTPTGDFRLVELLDRLVGLSGVRHLDKGETA